MTLGRTAVLALCGACFSKPPFDIEPRDGGGRGDSDLTSANVAFVTSEHILIAELGGVPGADALCNALAVQAELPANTYRAWLSSPAQSAAQKLANARGWVRVDGQPFADDISSLLAGKIFHPLRITDKMEDIGVENVATATTDAGGLHTSDCSGLVAGSAEAIQIGASDATKHRWTDIIPVSCSTALRLYCFGTDRHQPVSVMPQPGRLAFLSSSPWSPGGGRASADAVCASEAQAAGIVGSFIALLATTTSSPLAALDLGGPPWVRPDGVALVEDAVDLTIGILLAPINVTLDGAYHDDTVWTGMTNALPVTQASSSSATCSDWSSTTGSGTVAFASRSGQQWFRSTMQPPCTEARRLYCFEQ